MVVSKSKWYFIASLVVAIVSLSIIKSNILVIILFLQNMLAMGNIELNGLQLKKPVDYLLYSSYSVSGKSYLYGFIQQKDEKHVNDNIVARYSFRKTDKDHPEIDFYFLKNVSSSSNAILDSDQSEKKYFQLWRCGNNIYNAQILPEKYSNKYKTLYVKKAFVIILIKGDIAEIKRFIECKN